MAAPEGRNEQLHYKVMSHLLPKNGIFQGDVFLFQFDFLSQDVEQRREEGEGEGEGEK